jgi:hypothetical protein
LSKTRSMSNKTSKITIQRHNNAHYLIEETFLEQCTEFYGEFKFVGLCNSYGTAKNRRAHLTLRKYLLY